MLSFQPIAPDNFAVFPLTTLGPAKKYGLFSVFKAAKVITHRMQDYFEVQEANDVGLAPYVVGRHERGHLRLPRKPLTHGVRQRVQNNATLLRD